MRDITPAEEKAIANLVDYLKGNAQHYDIEGPAGFIRGIYEIEGARGVVEFFERMDSLPPQALQELYRTSPAYKSATAVLARKAFEPTRRQLLVGGGAALLTAPLMAKGTYNVLAGGTYAERPDLADDTKTNAAILGASGIMGALAGYGAYTVMQPSGESEHLRPIVNAIMQRVEKALDLGLANEAGELGIPR